MASTATSKSRMAGAASPAKQRSSSSSQEDRYRFTLANGKVTRLQEFARGRWTNESIDRNEAWSFDGTRLTRTEWKKDRIITRIFTDSDGDGVFTRSGRDRVTGLKTQPGAARSKPAEDTYRFSLVNGRVTNLQEFKKGAWKAESIDAKESWTFDGTRLTQMETKLNGVEVTTYTDPDKDGIFARASKMVTPFPTPSSSGLV